MQVWRLPAELTESRIIGPALQADDLLDFHLLLETDDWFQELKKTALDSINPRLTDDDWQGFDLLLGGAAEDRNEEPAVEVQHSLDDE